MDNSGIFALVQKLSDAERAQIGIAVLEYTLTGTTTQQMSPILSLAFETLKEHLSPTKDNRGGSRPGAGRPKIKKNQNNSKKSKTDFDFFDFDSGRNTAENRNKSASTTAKKPKILTKKPPLCFISDNYTQNQDNINNNINISITRARENSAKTQPAVDLFSAPAAAPQKQSKQSKFTPPTVEMVAEYCRERKNGIDPQHFIDHYTMRGWIPKGSTRQMTDWKAAVRTWERTGFNRKIPPDRPAGTAPPTLNPFAILDTPNGGK